MADHRTDYSQKLGYGLIFTSLQVLAVNSLPHEKIGQGSVLMNIIRQIEGCFEVVLFGLILACRNLFHSSVFGKSMDSTNPLFQKTMSNLHYAVMDSCGQGTNNAASFSKMLVTQYAAKTAYIQAIIDVFFIIAIMTFCCLIPVFRMKETPR